jgi:hypothetical protein
MRQAKGAACALVLCAVTCATTPASAAPDPGAKCEKVATRTLRRCVKAVNAAQLACYATAGAPCPPGAAPIGRALARLERKVAANCPDAATLAAAGYGTLLTPANLVARLQEACQGEPAALAARSFGGPHGAALAAAGSTERDCLLGAHDAGARLMALALREQSTCVLRVRRGRSCDPAATAAKVTEHAAASVAAIVARCGSTLEGLVTLDPPTFAARAVAQASCLAAASLADGGPLDLGCGPRAAVTVPPRGTATQIILPESQWGTRCGDGSPYAFQLYLPPAGQPVENIVVYLQGGGVCLLEADCAGVSPGLFKATDASMVTGGIMSNSALTNPTFATWAKVLLPYCTQDVHIGGGGVSNFPSITVHRFGAVNVRTALRYIRDVLWTESNATSAEGYRPDRLRVVFTGTSAGGFGVSYNYHYVLDDLRWTHTVAVPDSALGLYNGGAISIALLGDIMLSDVPPVGWASRHYLPPYCFASTCGIVPVIHAAHAARLLGVPEQQILSVSNQVDNTQVSTTFFPSLVSWINAVRASYCSLQNTPGLRYFLSANNSSIHGTVAGGNFSSLSSAGIVLRDWLGSAITAPAALTDAVSEGTLVATRGASPFACPVAP